MKRSIWIAPLTLLTLLGSGAHAQGLPNYNKALTTPASPLQMTPSRASNGAVASWDEQRGVPTFFWADRSSPASKPAAPLGLASPETIARAYIDRNAALYRLPSSARDAAYVRHIHDTGRGGVIVIFGQRVDGIEVFETQMKVLLDRQGSLVAIGGNLHT